jgi:hypothetical protein
MLIAFTYFAAAILVELWASGFISINVEGIGNSRDHLSSLDIVVTWLAPQLFAILIGVGGIIYILEQGYYHRGPFGGIAGAMYEWESHIRDIRTHDPNKVGMPLTHLLSLAMTVKRVAAHTYAWAIVWGLLALVSLLTVPGVARFISGPSITSMCTAAPLMLVMLSLVYMWRGHICQWTFLPVPEILRQFLVLIYLEKRDRGPEEAYILADAKLSECVKYCPECYLDRRGKLALLEDVDDHPRDV